MASKRLPCNTRKYYHSLSNDTKYRNTAVSTLTETSRARRHKSGRVRHILLRGHNEWMPSCALRTATECRPYENINATSSIMLHKQWIMRRIYRSQRRPGQPDERKTANDLKCNVISLFELSLAFSGNGMSRKTSI